MLLKIPSNKRVFATSDLHINHKNICRGTSEWEKGFRDFETLEEMNSTIINKINEIVSKDDILINLGDMFFGDKKLIPYWMDQINCKEIHYVYGNHCEFLKKNKEYQKLFSSTQDYLEINYNYTNFVCFHYPISSWNNHSKKWIHLYGHVHGNYKNHGKSLDVGWDNLGKPICFNEIINKMKNTPIQQVDHH